MPQRIHICEPLSCHAEHAPFNASLLETIRYAEPDAQLSFFAEAAHITQVQALLDADTRQSIDFQPQPETPRHASFRQRFLPDYRLMRTAMQGLQAQDRLVLSAGMSSILFALVAARLTQRSKPAIQVVMHGNLGDISGWRSRDPRYRLIDLRSAMTLALRAGVQFIVLEEGIRQAAATTWPALAPQLAVIEHPFPGKAQNTPPPTSTPLIIGFLGMAVTVKGFDTFVALADKIEQDQPGKCAFDVIGPLAPGDHAQDWPMLRRKPTPDWLSKEDYQAGLAQLHYVCLPYDPTHYRFSASGILLDAIRYTKPIIALRNATLEALFERYGDIGFLCDSKNDMQQILLSLAGQFDPDGYAQQCANVARLADDRLPAAQADNYRRAVAQLMKEHP